MPLPCRVLLAFVVMVGAALGVEPRPRVLFGDNGTYKLVAIEATNTEVAVDSGRLCITGPAGLSERAVSFRLAAGGEDLSAWRYVEAEVVNRGSKSLTYTFWAMSGLGWGGVSTYSTTLNTGGRETLGPGASAVIRIDLHARYSGRDVNTPAINPASVRWLEFVFENASDPLSFAVGAIRVSGEGLDLPAAIVDRIFVPDVESGSPAAGRRVFRQLPAWAGTQVKHVLSLPAEWKPEGKYPVIVEYAGNRFFHKFCYSTGRTADGKLAYGLARGERFICLNLPFVSADGLREQTDGWGDIDRAVAYALAAIEDAVTHFGADATAVVFTGFSRGDYAANYLALRDDRIAAVWRAFFVTRDPGAPWSAPNEGWRGVGRGWDERAARRGARPWFHLPAGLGAEVHADVEFLEDRPSTVRTRAWLDELVGAQRQR